MADNVAITAGTGTTIAADDVGGVLFQRVKLTFGADGAAADVSSAAPLPIDTVRPSTSTDRSGTITAGGTAQQLAPANTSRRGIVIQNQSTGDLYINGLGTAAASQASLRIPAGALYESASHFVGTGAISIFGATTGQAFYAREF